MVRNYVKVKNPVFNRLSDVGYLESMCIHIMRPLSIRSNCLEKLGSQQYIVTEVGIQQFDIISCIDDFKDALVFLTCQLWTIFKNILYSFSCFER